MQNQLSEVVYIIIIIINQSNYIVVVVVFNVKADKIIMFKIYVADWPEIVSLV